MQFRVKAELARAFIRAANQDEGFLVAAKSDGETAGGEDHSGDASEGVVGRLDEDNVGATRGQQPILDIGEEPCKIGGRPFRGGWNGVRE